MLPPLPLLQSNVVVLKASNGKQSGEVLQPQGALGIGNIDWCSRGVAVVFFFNVFFLSRT